MINSKTFLAKHTNLPYGIRNNRVFREFPEFNKVFPEIGLKNESICIKNFSPSFKGLREMFRFSTEEIAKMLDQMHLKKNFYNKAFAATTHVVLNYIGLPIVIEGLKLIKTYKTKFPDHKLVFSSDNHDGAWDIATMSMRGITSCMQWGSGQSQTLTGSIIDPYCGVIYITDNKETEFGSAMIYRSVVRLIVDKEGPFLLVEPLYFQQGKYKDHVDYIFSTYLASRSGLPVVFTSKDRNYPAGTFIPNSRIVSSIFNDERSYRDSKIRYDNFPKTTKFKNPKFNYISKLINDNAA